jgi:hypothetical protein
MRAISAAILLVLSSQVATEEALRPLLDFSGPEAAQNWQAVNDGVMGGSPRRSAGGCRAWGRSSRARSTGWASCLPTKSPARSKCRWGG